MGLATFFKTVSLLGEKIQSDWKSSNHDLSLFPELARSHLAQFQPEAVPTFGEVLNGINAFQIPEQTFYANEFSDLPLTLYRNENFCIDMYFWFSSDTTIHNHHFAGAFKVISGSSVQVEYEFTPENQLDGNVTLGKLKIKRQINLRQQDVETIYPDDHFIHHVFHIESPTVTLCVRVPFLKEKLLSTFLHQDFKITLRPLSSANLKWIHAAGLAFSQNSECKIDVPFSLGELILIHTYYKMKRIQLHSKLFELMERTIQQQTIGELYLKRSTEQQNCEKKTRFMANQLREST